MHGCVVGGDSGRVRTFDGNGEGPGSPVVGGWIDSVLHHAASHRTAVVSARALAFVDGNGGPPRIITGLPGAPTGAAFRWDGQAVAITHRNGFSVYGWDGERLADHIIRGAVRTLAWRPDGRYLCGPTQDGDLLLWQPADEGEILLAAEYGRLSLPCWSADSKWLAATHGGRVFLWPFADRIVPGRPTVTLATAGDTGVSVMAWHPLLPTLAYGFADGGVRVWAGGSGRALEFAAASQTSVSALAWSADGGNLLIAHTSGEVRVFAA